MFRCREPHGLPFLVTSEMQVQKQRQQPENAQASDWDGLLGANLHLNEHVGQQVKQELRTASVDQDVFVKCSRQWQALAEKAERARMDAQAQRYSTPRITVHDAPRDNGSATLLPVNTRVSDTGCGERGVGDILGAATAAFITTAVASSSPISSAATLLEKREQLLQALRERCAPA